MAFDKVIDSAVLDAGMTATANAIRAKTGGADPIVWDASNGFKTAVEGIEAGGGLEIKWKSDGGGAYVEIPRVVVPHVGLGEAHYIRCNECDPIGWHVFDTYGILEGYAPECVHCRGHYPFTKQGNPLLRKIVCPKMKRIEGDYWGLNLKSLELLQLGSVGNPVELLKAGGLGLRDTTDKLTIEVYVNAETLSDISTDITGDAPWCATSATIIYRNSTTGEVITE